MIEDVIRVVIVDDHRLVREGLKALLAIREGVEVVGDASSGALGLALVQELHPDVVLMDVTMPGMSGIEATKAICRLAPDVRVLGLTMHESSEYLARMLAVGASGYVLKGASSEELVTAIRSAKFGGCYVSAGLARFLGNPSREPAPPAPVKADNTLTAREDEIIDLTAKGRTNHEIAEILKVSISTIQTHRANIIRKLGLENSRQLVLYAIRRTAATTNTQIED